MGRLCWQENISIHLFSRCPIVERENAFKDIFAAGGAVASAFQEIQNKNIYLNSDFTKSINALARELAVENLQIENEGSLSLMGQASTLPEINSEVGDFFRAIAKEVSVQKILSLLSGLRKPVQKIVIGIFLHIIVPLMISAVYDYYNSDIQDFLESSVLRSNRDVKCAIKKMSLKVGFSACVGYRVVIAESLNLRLKPNMKSNVVEKLRRGKLVRVIQKKRNWTKVEVDISGSKDKRVGWVFTRYIVPIK